MEAVRSPPEPSKLYCYVDETGQDTMGDFFIVSVVVTDVDREVLASTLESIEQRSGKGKAKWIKGSWRTSPRLHQGGPVNASLQGQALFSRYEGATSYMALTVLSTAKAILTVSPQANAVVFVDGLPKSRLRWFGVELRRLSIRTRKVVGIRREETDPLIRLADACCGFVRAVLSGASPELGYLFEVAKRDGLLTEI